jgi:hypothetical protein
VTPGAGFAGEPDSNALILPQLRTAWVKDSAVDPVSGEPVSPGLDADWGPGYNKSYLIPALEIPAFLLTLNMLDRALYGTDIYGTNWNTGWDHVIHGPWTLDNDPFSMK